MSTRQIALNSPERWDAIVKYTILVLPDASTSLSGYCLNFERLVKKIKKKNITRVSGDNDFVLSTLAFCTLKNKVFLSSDNNDIPCRYTVYIYTCNISFDKQKFTDWCKIKNFAMYWCTDHDLGIMTKSLKVEVSVIQIPDFVIHPEEMKKFK